MPVSPKLSSMINRALSNNILSNKEAKRIYNEAAKDGVSTDEVNHIVSELAEALGDGLELDTTNRKKRVNTLLARLEAHHPLGLDESAIDRRPAGAVSYLDALLKKNDADPVVTDPVVTDPVTTDPVVTSPVKLNLAAPSDQGRLDAIGLVKNGTLATLAGPEQAAAIDALLDGLEAGLGYPGEDDQAFLKHTTATAAMGALLSVGDKMSSSDADRLLALYEKAPAPMAQSLMLAALDKATLSGAQKTALSALEAPEHKDVLIKEWNDVVGGDKKLGFAITIDGELSDLVLSGLAYCKKPASMEALYEGIKTFKDLNPGGTYERPFDGDEVSRLTTLLSAYTQKHDGLAYVFGTWKSDAPKHKAKVTNERISAELLPGLDKTPPMLGDVPERPDQVTLVKQMVGGVANEVAAKQLQNALKEAAFLTSAADRGYGDLAAPTGPM